MLNPLGARDRMTTVQGDGGPQWPQWPLSGLLPLPPGCVGSDAGEPGGLVNQWGIEPTP
jgi:hypothetical protein